MWPAVVAVLLILLAVGAGAGGLLAYRWRRANRSRRRERRLSLAAVRDDLLRVQRTLRRQQLERDLAAAGRSPRFPIEFTAQFGEDEFLFEAFAGKLEGVFIEVGAHDGRYNAVTFPFEAVGWRGLLVEPLPTPFAKCQACRPASIVVNAALGPAGSSGFATFTEVRGGGLDEQRSFLGDDQANARFLEGRGKTLVRIQTPLTTMDALLETHGARLGPEIDFAVIDVEGGELALLQGFDLARWRPKLLLIEDEDRPRDIPVREWVERHGYLRAGRHTINSAYVRIDLNELTARVQSILRPM